MYTKIDTRVGVFIYYTYFWCQIVPKYKWTKRKQLGKQLG